MYEKNALFSFLEQENVDKVLDGEYEVYCVPFTKLGCKIFSKNKLGKYLNNLGDKNHNEKNFIMTSGFYNGETFFERSPVDDTRNIIRLKPLLKVIHYKKIN